MATALDTTQLAEIINRLAENLTGTRPGQPYLELARQTEDLRAELEQLVAHLIHQARDQDGATWDEIAHQFGLNHRQAAQRKWRKRGERCPEHVG